MKSILLVISISLSALFNTTYAQDNKSTKEVVGYQLASFGVRGNCGMCKTTIEKAASNLNGVRSADWNRDRKQIVISFNPSSISKKQIHQAIANAGYDTDEVIANKKTYNNLPGCCQYDRKQKMNQKSLKKEDSHSGHHH